MCVYTHTRKHTYCTWMASNTHSLTHTLACIRSHSYIHTLTYILTHTHRYDRKTFEVRTIIDVIITGVMGPPGGGRTALTNRLMRHFNFIAFTEMGTRSLNMIFNTILGTWVRANFSSGDQVCVCVCVCVYLFMCVCSFLCIWCVHVYM